MALLINKEVTVLGDINLSQLYVRIKIHNGLGDNPLFLETQVYSSKEAYEENSETNSFYVEGVTLRRHFSYSRDTDGTDLLGASHQKIKDLLTTDVTEEQPVLDPSTGNPTYDPSTGDPITETVITVPKFCQDSSVSFVDVSIG